MTKTYIYRVIGNDQYRVSRVDNKKAKGDKERFQEYLVDLRNGDCMCDCKSFYYTKKKCKHIGFILSQLKEKGGILEFEKEGDYDSLSKEAE